MIEQGIVTLVQSDQDVLVLCPVGGFLLELPKNQLLPSWTYRTISSTSFEGLTTTPGLNRNRIQIDVYGDPGAQGADCLALAKAIDTVLSGYAGVLPDPDSIMCQACHQSDTQDFFEEANRGFRRMLEYEVWFTQ